MTVPWLDFLNAAPLLPSAAAQHWGWPLSWALLLAAAVAWAGQRLDWRVRCALVVGVAVATLWPGPLSPAYWLGLAFQSPSLTSAVLCAVWLLQCTPLWPGVAAAQPAAARRGLWALAVLAGWLLLGDTLAWWLPSLYAWGFGPAALLLVCAVLALLWLLGGPDSGSPRLILVLALVLLLFVTTRLPSGNLWDALLDPWLWLLLQGAALRALWRRARQQPLAAK